MCKCVCTLMSHCAPACIHACSCINASAQWLPSTTTSMLLQHVNNHLAAIRFVLHGCHRHSADAGFRCLVIIDTQLMLEFVWQAHCLDIVTMQRSPFMDDVILTVGDWTFALWRESRHDVPLIQSPCAPSLYTGGVWSPTRPGMLSLYCSFLVTATVLLSHR